jgi:glutamyl-tRNA synthetase
MEKYIELSNLIFPNIDKDINYLENKYPLRETKGEVTRLAPSPTGFLHTGTLFTSLINKKIAKQTEGIFFLRIEDTDKKREIDNSVELLTNEMKIFGIIPDEGVISIDNEIGNYGPYTQSKREEIYHICAKYLISIGLAYPCFCTSEMLDVTRKTQESNKVRPGYYGIYAKCRNLSVDEMIERIKSGENFILRFRSQGNHLKKVILNDIIRGKIEIAENDQDVVIMKSDGLPTYHFAHVVDDHFMRTTLVLRGEEWIPSYPIHFELFDKMKFQLPKYGHLPSVMINDNGNKRKLSKRKDANAAVSYFLTNGYEVDVVIEYLLGIINSDFESWRVKNENIYDFNIRLEKINSAGALIDMDKLNNISKEYISKLNSKELLERLLKWSKEYNQEVYNLLNKDIDYSLSILSIERDNAKKIRKDLIKYIDFLPNFFYFFNEEFNKDLNLEDNMEYTDKITVSLVKSIKSEYINIYNENDDKDTWFNNLKILAEKFNFCVDMKEYKINPEKYNGSIADFAGIIRVCITNRKNTPDIYSIMQVLGKEEIIKRLEK